MDNQEKKMTEADLVVFTNHRLGEIEVRRDVLLNFPVGLLGFSHLRQFALVPHKGGDSAFMWLVPLDDENLAFVVVNPDLFFDGYLPQPTPDQLAILQSEPDEPLGVLVLVSFHDGKPTANLAAPLILDLNHRNGIQAVLLDKNLETRKQLF
tara:strand:- start:20 stop:475 length:456 start_codon:yes stop_codon:yes gene_type:complete